MLPLTRSILAGALALHFCANAQFTVYTSANSDLTGDFITGLAPDTNGVWVATTEGLNHFDGLTWNNWTTGNSNLPHQVVTDLAVDDDGNLWSWNYDQGCSRFDGTTFEHFTGADGLSDNSGSNVMVLNNTVYAGTFSGLSTLQGSTWSTINTGSSELPNDDVRDCDIDGSSGLWIPTFGGGVAYYDGSWTIFDTGNSELPDDQVFVARVHPNGHVWFGTRNGLVDYSAGEFTVYTMDNSILEDNDIRNIEFGNDGEVIICTRYGGVYTIGTDANWTSYTTLNSNLPSDETWESLVDANGNLWVATTLGLATIPGWSSSTAVAEEVAFSDASVNINNGRLQVSNPEGPAHVRMFDDLGRTVWNSAGPVASVQQDMSALASGVYHVALWNPNGQRVWKVMVE
jgi:two-component system sensor histidine kinase ChiS